MQRFTINTELSPHADRKGLRAIYIRITLNRQKIRIGVGKSVHHQMWDQAKGQIKSGHPLSVVLNQLIRKKLSDIEKYIYEQQIKNIPVTLHQIKTMFSGKAGDDQLHVVSKYVDRLIEQMRGKFVEGTLFTYKNEARRIESYHPGVRFDQIDNKWLKGYESYVRGLVFKHNTVHKAFKTLAKFFNAAIKDGITDSYPFKTYERVKYRQSDRTYLTSKEVELIEKALLLPMDNRLRRAATWFLLGCYSGLRFSDWQRFDADVMIRGKDIVIRAKKNGQLVVMPIHSKLKKIIPELTRVGKVESEPNTNRLLKGVAKLCGIEKNLSTHTARHSFAVRCAELGISIETTADLMGINVKTCAIYYKVTGTKVRKEMAKWG